MHDTLRRNIEDDFKSQVKSMGKRIASHNHSSLFISCNIKEEM